MAGECLVQEPTPEGCEDLAPGSRVAPGELIGRGFSPGVLRIWLLSTSYHKPLVFSGPTLSMWSRNRARVQNLAARLAAFAGPGDAREEVKEAVAVLKKAFRDSVEDDLALYKFWPALFAFCREITSRLDRGEISAGGARSCLKQLMVVDDVLRVLDRSALPVSRGDLPEEVRRLVEERSKAREAKDYVRADELRKELRGLGYRLEDGPRGALVYFCMG